MKASETSEGGRGVAMESTARANRASEYDALASLVLPEWVRVTLEHVRQTHFGQVTLTIHQGEVIEVQKTERTRFQSNGRAT